MIKNSLWPLPFITFVFGYYSVSYFHQVTKLTTPAIVGKNIAQACKILSDHNLYPQLLLQKEEPDLPDGTILSQNPIAGSMIKSHQTIYFIVSTQPQPIIADTILNKEIEQAKKIFAKRNMALRTYYLQSSKPKNYCIAQLPQPGNPIKEHTMIAYVSRGNSKPVICPSFIGKNLQHTIEFLKSYNITPEITHFKNQKICPNTAHNTDQRPRPGSLIYFNQLNIQLNAQNISI